MLSRRQFLAAAALQSSPRPNIVFLCSDDHHYQCLGANGNPYIATPNLDKLAARGVNFTQGIISTPQCAPSRGILLSGLETYQSGLLSNGAIRFKPGLGPTIVEQLRRGGYATHLVGKWHIDDLPAACGFSHAPLWLRGGGSKYIDPALRRGLDGKDEPTPGHITELFSDAAINVIRAAAGPYLLWLTYNAPHSPWSAPDQFRPKNPQPPPGHPKDAKSFDWSTYYAVISHLDAHIGRVLAAIEAKGQWNNTLIVFLGDNGFLCGTKGLNGKVHPWEESIRVPYIVSGGPVKARGANAAPVASVNLPATFLDYAGVTPAYPLAGTSLKPLLSNQPASHEHAFASWVDPRPEALAIKQAVEPYRLVRTRTYKFIA
ncbi:MAG: sulfatase-like hydrolase/transferase, partial [Bryobacterales bacterium]|nr:sulfatase-like hydrolase/transferase [Bryobacterales bacterium]